MMPGVGRGKRDARKAHRGTWSCGRWKGSPLNWEKSETDIDKKGYRTISADFTNDQVNREDRLVQIASSGLPKGPAPADLSYNIKICLSDEKIKETSTELFFVYNCVSHN